MCCKSVKDFSLKGVFNPGENRLADSLIGRLSRGGEQMFLRFVRVEYPFGCERNRFWEFIDILDDEELESSYFERLEEAITVSEINQFIETLVCHGFIRTDNYQASLILAVICGNHVYKTIGRRSNSTKHKWFDVEDIWSRTLYYAVFNSDLYETVKPMEDGDMAVVLGVLEAILPPRQYEILGFCLTNRRDFYYTSCEAEALETAIKNLSNDEFAKEIINCIVS